MAALGLLSAAYGSFCAMAQRGLRRFVAYASIAGTGASLLGLGSLTSEGVGGALAGAFSRGLAAAMVLGVLASLERRRRSGAFTGTPGLSSAPASATVLVAGLATSLGAPCLVGFWGQALAVLGAFGKHPGMALLFAATLFALAVAYLRAARMLLLGDTKEPLAPPVELSPRELAGLAPVALLVVLLGLWPTPVLAAMTATVRDVASVVDPPAPEASAQPPAR